jgi:carboxylesterase
MPQTIPTAEPFFFPGQGENAHIGCLLIHGFTGAPQGLRWLGGCLNRRGYTVCGIRLAGHATRPADMIRTRWQDWLLSVEDGCNLLRSCTDQIFLLGLSMGGVLSLTAAAQFEIRGVVAMSAFYDLPTNISLPAWVIRILSCFMPYMRKGKVHKENWFDIAARQKHISYSVLPVRSASELKCLVTEMRTALPRINVPVLLIHSRDDLYLEKNSMQQIFDQLTTPDKHMLWVEGGGHNIAEEPTREKIFEAAADFIQRVSSIS